MRTVKAVCGVVLGASAVLTAGCGGSGKPAAPASSTASSGPARTLTSDQLRAVLPVNTDVPGYVADPSGDSDSVRTDPEQVTTGGALCQKFVDASDGLVSAYGTSAEVDRAWKNDSTGLDIQTAVMSYPSRGRAQAVVADAKAAVAGCPSLTSGTGSDAATISLTPLGDIAVGDASATYVAAINVSGVTIVELATTVQVGAGTFNVSIGGPGLDKAGVAGQAAGLKELATKEAAKLAAAQRG